MFLDFFKNLFRRKPKTVELVWYGKGVKPDGGSYVLSTKEDGICSQVDWSQGIHHVIPATIGQKLTVTVSPSPSSNIKILLYKYVGGHLIPMWCPEIEIGASGQGVLDMSNEIFPAGVSIQGWMGYPHYNTVNVDVKATLTLKVQ
jgi:hypothetical protein